MSMCCVSGPKKGPRVNTDNGIFCKFELWLHKSVSMKITRTHLKLEMSKFHLVLSHMLDLQKEERERRQQHD